MINQRFEYPIFTFKENDKNLYVSTSEIGFCSDGGGNFYKNLEIIDSLGTIYHLVDSKIKGRAPIWICIKYFQKMLELDLKFDKVGNIKLEDLKIKAMNQVKLKPKFWLSLDTVSGIQEMVDNAKTYKQLIMIFK